MEDKKQELKVEIIAVPDLSLIPQDITHILICELEKEISDAFKCNMV